MNFNKKLYKGEYYKYLNLRKKFLINNANIYFNFKCKQLNLTPCYAKSKNHISNKSTKRLNERYEISRMNYELKFLHAKKNFLSLRLYEQELRNMTLYGESWHPIKQQMIEKLSVFISRKYSIINNKIERLQIDNKPTIKQTFQPNNKCIRNCKPTQDRFNFHEPIKNLSLIQFSAEELKNIQRNYKSNLHTAKPSEILDNAIVESESIIRNCKENQDEIRYKISDIIKEQFKNEVKINNDNKLFNSVVKKIKQNNLVINDADKGNVITIESKDDLVNKTEEFLNNPNFTKVKTDPTNRFQNILKNVCKQSQLILNAQDIHNMFNPNPKAPKLRTNTKIHKINYPIRPIVNYMSAPAYKIKKYLNKYLKNKLIIENKYNIKNSINLAHTLKKRKRKRKRK